jgi:hypothetical protein
MESEARAKAEPRTKSKAADRSVRSMRAAR